MNSTRRIAVITGVLFIVATLAGPLLATPLTPDLTAADYLTGFSAHPNQVAGGVLLWIIAAFASAGIAIVDVSGPEGAECGSRPRIRYLQDPGGGLLHGRRS